MIIHLPRTFFLAAFLAVIVSQCAFAHEYYLMPDSFTPQIGDRFAVRHRLGQKFKGNQLPYIGAWNIRSEVWKNGQSRTVGGQDGDRPALTITAGQDGLLSVIHQSNVDFLKFKTWEKFIAYANKEGLEHALLPSERGDKPKTGLLEAYARYAKTLVSVNGTANGRDTPVGLKIELVALAHPRSLEKTDAMPVQLLYEGRPLEHGKIKVFIGIGTEFAYQVLTDGDGKALIPAGGPGPYLLNTIHMTEPQGRMAKEKGAHWESFWASLTFERAQ